MSRRAPADPALARLKRVAALSDLRPEHRLAAKIDYSAQGVDSRLRKVSELRRLCLDLAADGSPRAR